MKVSADDRAGKTVAERIKSSYSQDYSKRLDEWERAPSGNGGNVRAYATGERGAERARDAWSAGGTLERATAAFEPVVQRHEMAVAAERH